MAVEDGTVLIAAAEPVQYLPYDVAASLQGQPVSFVLAPADQLARALGAEDPACMSGTEHESLAAAMASQIEAAVAAAEQAANEFRQQVETSAQEQAARTREAAESDARRIRQETAAWAAEYLEDSKRIIDEFTAERLTRISSLTDELIQGAESLQRRFTEAQTIRRQVYDLISALGAVAEIIALEAKVASPELPVFNEPPAEGPPPSESADFQA